MAVQTYYGNYAGPSGASFRVVVQYDVANYYDTGWSFRRRTYLQVDNNFYGTLFSTSWYGQVTVNGPGTYADTGWRDDATVYAYGRELSVSANAGYTGSQAYYGSQATGTFTASAPTWAPYAPSGVSHARNSNTKNTVKWTNNAKAARPYASQTVQRSVDGGDWANLKTGLSGGATSYEDASTSAGHSYRYRVVAVNGAGSATSDATAKTLNTPSAPTGVTNTRESDTKNTVKWTRHAPDPALYASQTVQRSVDGGEWADLKTGLPGGAESYTDSSTSAGHSYRYRVVAVNATGSATSAASGRTYNTPTAPSGVTNRRDSDTRNTVSWTSHAPDAGTYASISVQRSTDGGAWQTVASGLAGGTTSWQDTSTSAGHSYKYRVAAVNSSGTSWSGESAKTYNTPAAPSGVTNRRSSDTSNAVSWTRNCPDAALYTSQRVQRSVDGGAWADLATGLSATATGYTDATTQPGHSYAYRVAAVNGSGTAWSGGSGKTLNTPAAPSSVAHVRESDAKNTVTWVRNCPDPALYASQAVQRSTDGGAWETVASGLAGSATGYTDASVSAGHSYSYRVGATNGAGTAWSAASATTANTPAVPTVSAARSGDVSVAVELRGVSATATAVEVQRQRSGESAWADAYSGSPVSQVTDTPGAGSWRYRARATRGELASAWSEPTGWVTPMAPPNAPAVGSPEAGRVYPTTGELALEWAHATVDGSAQAGYQAEYSDDGGATFSPLSEGTTATGVSLPHGEEGEFAARVRTKGVSGEWGPWSTVAWSARVPPEVAVTAPSPCRAVPFEVSWDTGAMGGSQASATVRVSRSDAPDASFTVTVASEGSVVVGASDLVPADGGEYLVEVEVRSTYGLTGSGSASMAVEYDAPARPLVSLSVDRGAGAVEVRVEPAEGRVPTASIDVWREGALMASGLAGGETVRDPLPPLDRPVEYVAVAHAPSGAVSQRAAVATVPSGAHVFLNWGEGWGRVAKGAMNLRPEERTEREVELMAVRGQRRRAAMYGERVRKEWSISVDVWWEADVDGDGEAALYGAWAEAAEHVGDYALRMPRSGPVRVSGDIAIARGDWRGVATVTASLEEVCGGLV